MPKTKRLSQALPDLSADAKRFIQDVQKETDRGVALVSAAFLNDTLAAMLRAFFVDDPGEVDKLLNAKAHRPLSTFASRIQLAYCLGLLGPNMYRDLNVIRDIRNDVGHQHHHVSFDLPSIKNQCENLAQRNAPHPDRRDGQTRRASV